MGVGERHNGVPFRVNTSGVVRDLTQFMDRLISSNLVALGDRDLRRETRIQTVSVALPASDPATFEKVTGETETRFGDVCSFICTLAEAGVNVECTTVEHPDVNIETTKQLAIGMGAQ